MKQSLTPDRLGAVLLSACVVVLVLALGGAAVVESWQRQTDDRLHRDTPDAGRLVVLLDVSDPPTRDQAVQLEDRLGEVAESVLRPGDNVSVWTLGASTEGPLHRVLSLHYPLKRSNPLYQNPRHMLQRYDSLFTRPVHMLAVKLPETKPARWSPILEAICAMAELSDLRGTGPRRLLIVSDLQQHTSMTSFCARQPAFEAFRRSPFFASVRPNLQGVVVEILFVPRAREDLNVELARKRFWRSYFLTAGAQAVEFERL